MNLLRIALTAILISLLALATNHLIEDAGDKMPQRITEDDPRWDCETMGNRTCGTN